MVSHLDRKNYLHRLGFKFDPFESIVTEHEVSGVIDIPNFYNYFCEPLLITESGETLNWDWLQRSENLLLFAEPGMGKTALRLAHSAECRRVFTGSLAVNYVIEEDPSNKLDFMAHGQRLAEALAFDFFISFVERFSQLEKIFEDSNREILVNRLSWFIQIGGKRLRHLTKRLIEDPRPEGSAGLGVHWPIVGRPVVQRVPFSSRLVSVLQDCLEQETVDLTSGWEAFWEGSRRTSEWGIDSILVLIDGVDAHLLDGPKMLEIIQPILTQINKATRESIYFKLFLPSNIRNLVLTFLRQYCLSPEPVNATIIWDREQLRRLLTDRLRAADIQYGDLDALAGTSLEGGLVEPAIDLADGSPRRLLKIISTLIDEHIKRSTAEASIEEQDWQQMLISLKGQLPAQRNQPNLSTYGGRAT